MRDLSVQFLEDIFAESTGATPVLLMRVLLTPNSGGVNNLYFCQNGEPVTSGGITYQPAAFNAALGKDVNNEVPTVNLTFDAGDRSLITQLREYTKPPKFFLKVVVAERPDVVEFAEVEYRLTSWTINQTIITMQLQVEPVLNEPIPADRVTPLTAPAMWVDVTVDNTGVSRPTPTNPNYSGDDSGGGGNDQSNPSEPEYPELLPW